MLLTLRAMAFVQNPRDAGLGLGLGIGSLSRKKGEVVPRNSVHLPRPDSLWWPVLPLSPASTHRPLPSLLPSLCSEL